MEIIVCGTSAPGGLPAMFCGCGSCKRARQLKGKDLRTRPAYMIGETLRIDFGPDSNFHQIRDSLEFWKIRHLLVTRSQSDYWHAEDVAFRKPSHSRLPKDLPSSEFLRIWGNNSVEAELHRSVGPDPGKAFCSFSMAAAFQPIEAGTIRATPVLASTAEAEECYNYLVEPGESRILFGTGTGWYPGRTWDFLAGKPLDLVFLDATHGTTDNNINGLGGTWVIRARDELATRGSLKPDAQVYAAHFSHSCGATHQELEEYFRPHGIGVAYDGLRIVL